MSVPNSIFADLVTMLTVHILIDGKEILLHVLRNEDVTKGVLMSWTHVESRSVHTLNETTFLVTYSSSILAEEIGSSIEKIDVWLGKPVVIKCDEVTTAHLPQMKEHACCTTGVESVVFNTRIDGMQSDFNQSVQRGYHGYAAGPAVLGASGTTFLNKIPRIPHFLVQNEKKTLSGLNSGFMLSQMAERISMSN